MSRRGRVLGVCVALLLACTDSDGNQTDGGVEDGGGNAGKSGHGGSHAGAGAGGSAGTGGKAGGGAGGASGSTAGTGGAAGSTAGNGGGGAGGRDCPPECLRAYECATSCTATPFNNGCCACPPGTIDVITCPADGEGHCGLPCMGVKPDDDVVAACSALLTEQDCNAYTGTGFPNHCEWHTAKTPPCLAP